MRPLRICYFLTDRHGPGNLRSLLPAAELERQYGWEFRSMQTLTVVRGHLKYDADIYVMQRQHHRSLPLIVEDLTRRQGKCVIGEVDDWFIGLSTVQDIGSKAARQYYTQMPKILSRCSGMTVSTPELKEGYGERIHGVPIEVIENTLDWTMWEDVVVPPSERLRVGWMGGAPWHLRDLAVVQGTLARWLQDNPSIQFVAAGDGETHELLEIPAEQRVTYGTVPYERLPEITATFDIGLVPLGKSRFNDAKSYLKGLEYAACGIPCIASSVREYRTFVEHGVTGFIAETHRDWIKYLNLLVSNPTLRKQMGEAARAKAAQHTIQEKVHHWHRFYMERWEAVQAANEGRTLESEFTLLDLNMLDQGWYEQPAPEEL